VLKAKSKMGGACSTHEEMRHAYHKTLVGKHKGEELGVDGAVMLKLILNCR
jgi:hypothetical protein